MKCWFLKRVAWMGFYTISDPRNLSGANMETKYFSGSLKTWAKNCYGSVNQGVGERRILVFLCSWSLYQNTRIRVLKNTFPIGIKKLGDSNPCGWVNPNPCSFFTLTCWYKYTGKSGFWYAQLHEWAFFRVGCTKSGLEGNWEMKRRKIFVYRKECSTV